MNRRASVAGFNGSENVNVKPNSRSRKSMAPRVIDSNQKERASNTVKGKIPGQILNGTPPKQNHTSLTTRIDPRPIQDKTYFTTCVRKLQTYLETHNYPHPIKFKDLTKPSSKDFHNFTTFLLRKIDPTFQKIPSRKFEDEVVIAFKTMGYPFNISKTSLVAAGSPHIWPSLLLAISWLIERLELISATGISEGDQGEGLISVGVAGQPFVTPEDLDLRTERAFLLYIDLAYNKYLSGDDETYEALEEEFLDYFEKDQMVLEQEIEKVTDENAVVVESITNVGTEMNE